ncbi:MAG: quinolinate synthase NadA, partial [Firmicutes bacterium]|nr:quinolinate synthase NadA [Bacillota bacterium]
HCPTHDRLTAEEVRAAKSAHPGAEVMVHPECRPEVIDLADVVASTSGMLRHARESGAREFIVGTETGILHQLRKQCPDKHFYPASPRMVCPNMKATTLEKVKRALETLEPRITVPPDVRTRALASLERMLQIV